MANDETGKGKEIKFLDFFTEASTHPNYNGTKLHLEQFLKSLAPTVAQVTPHLLEQFVKYLNKQDLEQNTKLQHWRNLKAVLSRAVRKRLIAINPMTHLETPFKFKETEIHFLTAPRIQELIDKEPVPKRGVERRHEVDPKMKDE